MVYKFRSLREPNLQLAINDTDGDQTTVNFEAINGPSGGKIGLFETEETKIAEAMLVDKRNGVLYMDSNYVEKTVTVKPKAKKKASAPKMSTISEKPKKKRNTKRKK